MGSKQEELQLANTAAEQWHPWVCKDKWEVGFATAVTRQLEKASQSQAANG